MQKEKKHRRGWGTAKCVSDASRGRWKCRKSEGWRVGRLGAMGFWLHAYHFKRQPVKGSLLLCKPRSIFLCVSLLLTRGEVDHFWPNSYGLICCAVFILWDNLCPGEAAHSVARVSLGSTLSYLMWAAAVTECNIFGVWHCYFNSSSSPPGGERRGGGRLSRSDLCYVNTTLLFLKYGCAFFRAMILLSAVFVILVLSRTVIKMIWNKSQQLAAGPSWHPYRCVTRKSTILSDTVRRLAHMEPKPSNA